MMRVRPRLMRRPWASRTVFVALAVTFVGLAGLEGAAHEGATGIVKERMDAMKSMGAAMKAVAAMIRGEAPYDAARVEALASKIGTHGGDAITKLFPEGSLHKPTRALPAIWSDWAGFSAMAEQLSDYATALGAAAGNDRPGDGLAGGDNLQATVTLHGNSAVTGNGALSVDVEELSGLPPDFAFALLARSCAQCHNQFRQKK